jgi:hypothetical protein
MAAEVAEVHVRSSNSTVLNADTHLHHQHHLSPHRHSSGSNDIPQLQRHLNTAWASHAIVGPNNVTVVEASAGRWFPHGSCASPELWLFLSGHARTFAWTAPFFARFASATASDCAFIVAAVPDELDAPLKDSTPGGAYGRVDHAALASAFGPNPEVAALLQRVAITSLVNRAGAPAVCYAVLRRRGAINNYPAALAFGWHAVWALAQWASWHHGIEPDPSSIVIRTRPDVLLTLPLELASLRRYVAHGRHGRHLMLGQAVKRATGSNLAQSDVHAIFSFGSYEADVAKPLERAGDRRLEPRHGLLWWQRGFASGWGYGRAVDVWAKDARRFGRPLGPLSHAVEALFEQAGHVAGLHGDQLGGRPGGDRMWFGNANGSSTSMGDGAHENASQESKSPMERCVNSCLCLDGVSTTCQRPSCLVTVAESLVVKTDACNVQRHLAAINATSRASAGPIAPCVLRGPLPWPPNRDDAAGEVLMATTRFDLAASVSCYCAAETTTPEAIASGALVCSDNERGLRGSHCFRARDGSSAGAKLLANNKKVAVGHYRCKSGARLEPEAVTVKSGARLEPEAFTVSTAPAQHPSLGVSRGVWPEGCNGPQFAAPQPVVTIATCFVAK